MRGTHTTAAVNAGSTRTPCTTINRTVVAHPWPACPRLVGEVSMVALHTRPIECVGGLWVSGGDVGFCCEAVNACAHSPLK